MTASASTRRRVNDARSRLNAIPAGQKARDLLDFITAHSRYTDYKFDATWADVETARARDAEDRLAGGLRFRAWLVKEQARPVPTLVPTALEFPGRAGSTDGLSPEPQRARRKLAGLALRVVPSKTATVEECRIGGLGLSGPLTARTRSSHQGQLTGERTRGRMVEKFTESGSTPKKSKKTYHGDPYMRDPVGTVSRCKCSKPFFPTGLVESPTYLQRGALDDNTDSGGKKRRSASKAPTWHKAGPGSAFSVTPDGRVSVERPSCERCGRAVLIRANLHPVFARAEKLGLRLSNKDTAEALVILGQGPRGACRLLFEIVASAFERAKREDTTPEPVVAPAPPPRLELTWENAGAARGDLLVRFIEGQGVLDRVLRDRTLESHIRRYRQGRNATFDMADRILHAAGLHPSQAPRGMWLERAPRPSRRVTAPVEQQRLVTP